jgi:hypothetical protein
MAFRIAESGLSINIKSYQLIVSIIGLSTLLAQILLHQLIQFQTNLKQGGH